MRATFERYAPALVFPVVVGGALALLAFVQAAGENLALALLAAIGVPLALMIALERVIPHDTGWNRSHADVATDIAHTLVVVSAGIVTIPLVVTLSADASAWLGSLGVTLWPHLLPWPLELLFALLAAEIGPYWVHRLQHRSPRLWRFHAVHHSAPRLYWLNTYRFHVVDILLVSIPRFALPILLGIPLDIAAAYLVVAYVIAWLEHSNVRCRAGLFNWLFVTPELHRWHHARPRNTSGHNFGQTVIVWDILFGTRLLPAGETAPTDIGIEEPADFPMTFWGQVVAPLALNPPTR